MLEPDAELAAINEKWQAEVSDYTSEILCTIDYRLNADRPDIRNQETNLEI